MQTEEDMNAYEELLDSLMDGEHIEKIILSDPKDSYGMEEYHIPASFTNVPLTLEEARPYLYGWQIAGGYGGEEVIPLYVWTNKRVLFIGSYDGSTWLAGIPRNPSDCKPYTIGG